MEPILVTNPKLLGILEQLKKREPIFHRSELGISRRDFEDMTDTEFWEVGASGKKYSREYVINTVVERYNNPNYKNEDIWETSDFYCSEIAPNHYLLTYTLIQGSEKRKTHRCTIWHYINKKWKVLYHQGTIIQDDQ